MQLSEWKKKTRSTWVEIGEIFGIDKSTAFKYAKGGADIKGKIGERVLTMPPMQIQELPQ